MPRDAKRDLDDDDDGASPSRPKRRQSVRHDTDSGGGEATDGGHGPGEPPGEPFSPGGTPTGEPIGKPDTVLRVDPRPSVRWADPVVQVR